MSEHEHALEISYDVSKLMPEAMRARRANAEEDAVAVGGRTAGEDDEEGNLPMFVMDVMLPGQSMQLNIFEPRYRLLVRRCMEGSRRFGMVGFDRQLGRINEWAAECEIVECEPFADGRYYINIVGRRRCRAGVLPLPLPLMSGGAKTPKKP